MQKTTADTSTLCQASLISAPAVTPPTASKLQTIILLMQRPHGAEIDELVAATTWQKHSIRGAISGVLKRKQNLNILSTKIEGRGRVYRIDTPDNACIDLIELVATDIGGQL